MDERTRSLNAHSLKRERKTRSYIGVSECTAAASVHSRKSHSRSRTVRHVVVQRSTSFHYSVESALFITASANRSERPEEENNQIKQI